LLSVDGAEERQREEDRTMRVCAACFLLHSKTNTACELCGGSKEWLVPSEARSNPEHDMFMRIAAAHTIEDLRIALRSGWAKTPERERVARLLLVSREARVHSRQKVNIQTIPEYSQSSILNGIDLKKVETYLDYRIAQLWAEQDALAREVRQEPPTTSASAL
jgi:hypothetical protein